MLKAIKAVTVITAIISAITTAMGLIGSFEMSENHLLVSVLSVAAAAVTALIASVGWLVLFKWIVHAKKTADWVGIAVLTTLLCATIFGSSTIWSIIGMTDVKLTTFQMTRGMDVAQDIHDQLKEQIAEGRGLHQTIDVLSSHFSRMADAERGGTYSTYQGEGRVTVNLEQVSATLVNLSDHFRKSQEERDELADLSQVEIDQMRRELNDSTASLATKVMRYRTRASKLNELFSKIQNAELAELIREVTKNLSEMSGVEQIAGASKMQSSQREAMRSLSQTIAMSRETLMKFADKVLATSSARLPQLTLLETVTAVKLYWREVIMQITFSIAMDFNPLLWLLPLYFIGHVMRSEEEQKQRERAAARLATELAEPAGDDFSR